MRTIGTFIACFGIGWALYTIAMCLMDLGRRVMRYFDKW